MDFRIADTFTGALARRPAALRQKPPLTWTEAETFAGQVRQCVGAE